VLTPTLLYHDVVRNRDWTSSGFNAPGAAVYKMRREDFAAHLERLAALGLSPSLVGEKTERGSWRLSFDDGGISALTEIAPLLAERGWRAHFFVTTGCVGAPGFLSQAGIRELAAAGHLIGSHSVTHPLSMASCSRQQLDREWGESTRKLGEILGNPPRVASIPGGAYSRAVAQAAGAAGIRILFTSEPTARCWEVDGVMCLGRYTLWREMRPDTAFACARDRGLWPFRQRLAWNSRKVFKRTLGPAYLLVRGRLLQNV
jgi:peptidoglycan/xylan/chitin deacetylase (PgdA/CDA1 family)